jgi:hypothetical protein
MIPNQRQNICVGLKQKKRGFLSEKDFISAAQCEKKTLRINRSAQVLMY